MEGEDTFAGARIVDVLARFDVHVGLPFCERPP
jgi:hypothetical protein